MNTFARRFLIPELKRTHQFRLFSDNVTLKEKRIGIIGMGNVGNTVIKNLRRNGYNVTSIHDIDQSKLKEFEGSCKIAANPRSLVSEVDVCITALPKPPNIKDAFEGPDGMLAGMSNGKIWIDHSTTDFEQTVRFSEKLLEKGAYTLESPITGGLAALRKGQMTTLVAGHEESFKTVKPILEASFINIVFTGAIGSAVIPKALSNIIAAMNIIAASEALVILKRAGMDMPTAFDAMRASAANGFVWETAVPLIIQGNYENDFTIDLHCKDNQLVFDVAKRFGVPIELFGHVQQMYNRALSIYGGEAPCYIPAKLIEDTCNESLQDEAFKDWAYSAENIDGSIVIRHHGIDIKRTGHPLPE